MSYLQCNNIGSPLDLCWNPSHSGLAITPLTISLSICLAFILAIAHFLIRGFQTNPFIHGPTLAVFDLGQPNLYPSFFDNI